jgi:hypothetical protein
VKFLNIARATMNNPQECLFKKHEEVLFNGCAFNIPPPEDVPKGRHIITDIRQVPNIEPTTGDVVWHVKTDKHKAWLHQGWFLKLEGEDENTKL